MEDFTSEVNWQTLKIGPESVMNPEQKKQLKEDMYEEENSHEELR